MEEKAKWTCYLQILIPCKRRQNRVLSWRGTGPGWQCENAHLGRVDRASGATDCPRTGVSRQMASLCSVQGKNELFF